MARLGAQHVRVLVVPEVGDLARPVHPRVPHHRVREVVLLQPHLPPRHHVRDDVLLRRVLVDPVCPLVHRDHVPALLVDVAVPGLCGSNQSVIHLTRPEQALASHLIYERATVKSADLASPHVWHLQICVQQQVERKRNVFAGIINADVEVQLLLAQNQPIGDSEPSKTNEIHQKAALLCRRRLNLREIPHRSGEVAVHQGQDGLDVAIVQPFGRSL